MGYRLARGTSGWLYVVALTTLAAVVGAVIAQGVTRATLVVLAVALVLILGLVLNFFRDPERPIGPGVVSPADGVVTLATPTPEGGTRVNIFMNPLDVHVNRAPVAGRVLSVKRKPGGYVPAFKKESERNERVEWVLETELGEVRFVQIAGTLARRIIPYVGEGDVVEKGERIGIIRVGSRVDVFLPAGTTATVREGEKVRAGETRIATTTEA